MRAAVLPVALAATLVAVAPARSAPVDDALAVARATFPAACSPVTVHGDGERSAPTDWGYDWTRVVAAAWQGPAVPACELWLRSDWTSWPWLVLCTEVVHEVGHLAGAAHSPDPSDVMYAEPDPLTQLARCGLDPPSARRAHRHRARRPATRPRARRPGGPSAGR